MSSGLRSGRDRSLQSEDSVELASELDDALNELGMLSHSSGTAVTKPTDLTTGGLNRKEFLKDKWRRGRYPLRREKEREICWSSSSSSGSCGGNSSQSSSRRSSNSSICSGSCSFSSIRSSYSTRSPLLSSYSIAETPTGSTSPSTAQSTGSSSGFASGPDMRMQTDLALSGCGSGTCLRSVDVVKVLNRCRSHRPSPYRRRCSLNTGFGHKGVNRSSSCSFYSPPVDNLILRSGLSDSEASSGSGTGTPPPPHFQPLPVLSVRPNCFETSLFKTFADVNSNAETKSNPCSPESSNYDMNLVLENTRPTNSKDSNRQPSGNFPAARCGTGGCPYASTAHVHSCQAVLSRSKSLDDLTSVAYLSEDSSSSDYACHVPSLQSAMASGAAAPGPGSCFPSLAPVAPSPSYHLHLMHQQHQQQQQQQQQHLQQASLADSAFLKCSHVPIHHHSHHQLQSLQANTPSDLLLPQPMPLMRSSSGSHAAVLSSCDSNLVYENVVHRMNQLGMN